MNPDAVLYTNNIKFLTIMRMLEPKLATLKTMKTISLLFLKRLKISYYPNNE